LRGIADAGEHPVLEPLEARDSQAIRRNIMSSITKYALAAAAAATLTAWQGVALGDSLSGSQDQTRAVVVRFADLDLNKPRDVQILYHRISLAAGVACGEREGPGSRLPPPSWQRCVAVAVESAVSQLDRPALSAYHRSRTTDAVRRG
jgi:UrcA family protein